MVVVLCHPHPILSRAGTVRLSRGIEKSRLARLGSGRRASRACLKSVIIPTRHWRRENQSVSAQPKSAQQAIVLCASTVAFVLGSMQAPRTCERLSIHACADRRRHYRLLATSRQYGRGSGHRADHTAAAFLVSFRPHKPSLKSGLVRVSRWSRTWHAARRSKGQLELETGPEKNSRRQHKWEQNSKTPNALGA
jgi:hypothetical protein